jgi:hypothetical protein
VPDVSDSVATPDDPHWLRTVRRIFAILLGLALAGIVVSGLYLSFRYFPYPASVFGEVRSGRHSKPALLGYAEAAHVVFAVAALVCSLFLGATLVIPALRGGRRFVAWVVGGVGLIAALGYGLVTGGMLAWDQLALWAVTTGTGIKGVWNQSNVRFYIVDNFEVSRSDYRSRVVVHTIVLTLVVLIALALLAFVVRRRGDGSDQPSASPDDEDAGSASTATAEASPSAR